ncbi:hypothetical protein [Herpetosiphon giganteus]|uniref:hypothetical protein n=1 Tax=Herpetosiphon giganteus TaxID=2029754 RepID=UPI00195D5F4A|nr:hypothetical protein [Herpetosiphon giganteus]MBM7845672.1 hypothetical protein [Herpetosiphon giganteus]
MLALLVAGNARADVDQNASEEWLFDSQGKSANAPQLVQAEEQVYLVGGLDICADVSLSAFEEY